VLIEKSLPLRSRRHTPSMLSSWEWATHSAICSCAPNADQPDQAENAIAFLELRASACAARAHVLWACERIVAVREMILADTIDERELPRPSCCPCSAATSRASSAPWASVRYDPHARPAAARVPAAHRADQKRVAAEMNVSCREDRRQGRGAATEFTPCSDIAAAAWHSLPRDHALQATAILEAACIVKADGVDVHPEIMIRWSAAVKELEDQVPGAWCRGAGVRREGMRSTTLSAR